MRLVTAGTGELLRQLMDCFLSATSERLTVPLALETEAAELHELLAVELSTS